MDKYIYLPTDRIGGGMYGDVFVATDTTYNRRVAIKRIKLRNPELTRTVLRECSIHRELDHPNIVKLHKVLSEQNCVFLIMEHVQMNLSQHWENASVKYPAICKRLLQCLLSGIAYCHSAGVIHRDIKPTNLLINENSDQLMIADFGSSRAVISENAPLTPQPGTLPYTAPEMLLGARYSSAVDIWSIGIIFAEMHMEEQQRVDGDRLFGGIDRDDVLRKIFRQLGTPTEVTWPRVTLTPRWSAVEDFIYPPQDISLLAPGLAADGLDLLSRLLTLDPKKRISASDALQHPYFRDFPSSSSQSR